MQKKLYAIFVTIFVLLSVVGCSNGNVEEVDFDIDVPITGFGDPKTGIVISLGMEKSEVDGLFTMKPVEKSSSIYVYDSIYVSYDDDKVRWLYVEKNTRDNWETGLGIKVGSTKGELIEMYGEPDKILKTEYTLIYYEDGLISNFGIDNEKVYQISIQVN